jgi:hypothetical protein
MLRLVLDTSAVLVYARGGEDAEGVGELVREVAAEEDTRFGVPTICLAEASLWLRTTSRTWSGFSRLTAGSLKWGYRAAGVSWPARQSV